MKKINPFETFFTRFESEDEKNLKKHKATCEKNRKKRKAKKK